MMWRVQLNLIAIKLALILIIGLPVQAEQLPEPQVYIFISTSMAESNLIVLASEAKVRNAQLVLRGLLNNSFEQTAKFLANMIQKTGQGVVIDPTLFQDYEVTVVPTFVVVRSYEQPKYDKIAGNISLAAALQRIGRL